MVTRWMKFVMLAALSASTGEAAAQTESLPSTMILGGTVSQSSDGKVVPVDGDSVLVVNPAANTTEASGVVNNGAYALILSGTNGTSLALNLMHAGGTYKLLFADGSNAAFSLSGSFLPVRTTMNVVASSQTTGNTGGTGDTGNTPPPAAQVGDLNGDGVVNEVDVGLLKQAISGQTAIDKTKMDINGDQVVNTRDLIDLIRSVREKSRIVLKPVSIIPAH